MSSLIIQGLLLGLVGSFIGGFVARASFRKLRGISIFKISENLCDNCKLRFRLVELIPILGTALTGLKVRDYKYKMVKETLALEVLFFIGTPVVFLTSPYVLISLLIFAFMGSFAYYTVREFDNLDIEEREERYNEIREITRNTQIKYN